MLWDHGQCISPEYECEQGEWKQPIPRELKDISYPFTVTTGYPWGIVMKHCEIQSGIAICKTFIHR